MIEIETNWSVGDKVTHNYHGGEGIVLEMDKIHSKVSWKVNAPPHIRWYYNSELRLLKK